MSDDFAALVYRELKNENRRVQRDVSNAQAQERAEFTDSIPAYTFANLPLAATGGLGDGTSYITLAWCSNGRKPGEGVGAGTGVLAFYKTSANQWFNIHDYAAVSI